MPFSRSTCLGFVVVVMGLSITVLRESYQDRVDRYPVVEAEETEPTDPVKKAKLRKQQQRYDKDAPFTNPGPNDQELAFWPESQFNFPALPIIKSAAIVVGQVLTAEAHRSANKMNVFSNFEVRVEEVLKGHLNIRNVINIQRVGGVVKYPGGRKVLFRLIGNGMPGVGSRYVFFLNVVDEDYTILTAYELAAEGVVPLDNSTQFQAYKGVSEISFTATLRDAIAQAVPQ